MIRRHRNRREVPGLNMASMPDLIFTVLFFFMLVTHMRKEDVKVDVDVPAGTEVTTANKKYATATIYIGKDKSGKMQIQFNDRVVQLSQIAPLVNEFRSHLQGEDMESMTINIRADKKAPMGLVNDVKLALRKAGALTIRYSALEENTD